MSDQQRRRLRPAPAPRRVGEPNVLSNQATPNRLSTLGPAGRQASPASASGPSTARPAVARPTLARPTPIANRTPQAGSDEPTPRRRRLPSLGTLITIGFLIFWAARAFGGTGTGSPGATARPEPTTAPGPSLGARPTVGTSPGVVVFGESISDNGCDLVNSADRFPIGHDIWWQAETSRTVAADETVVYVAKRDDIEIDRETVPPDTEVGAWSVLCGGRAVPGSWSGRYRVEIWDESEHELLASGEYTKFDARATASPTPMSTARVTAAPGTVGVVSFGTSLGAACTLDGEAKAFVRGVDVWWRAELLAAQPSDADVLAVTLHDDRQIGREFITANRAGGAWSVVCARSPSLGVTVGTYSVEVWDELRRTLLATGTFARTP